MLSSDERREIEAELAHYPTKRAVAIDALKIVQRHRGWVSDEGLADVGALLEMSLDELEGLATFFNLIFREPVGRHVILVCDSVSCWVMGFDAVRARLSERLGIVPGGTTADGRFTLLPVVCLGACDRAPVLMVDGDLHERVEPDKIDGILEAYR